MTHWIYGYLLMNRAEEALNKSTQEQSEETEKEVTNYFRSAAGVFEYIQNSISVYNQIGLNISSPGFPETFSVFAEMLVKYCITMAQVVAIKTAIHKNKSFIVIAKLSIAVYKSFDKIKIQFDEVQKLVTNLQNKASTSLLDQKFSLLISQHRVFYRSFSLKYLALDFESKEFFFIFFNFSLPLSLLLVESALKQLQQMKPCNSKFQSFSSNLNEELEELKEKFKTEEKCEKILSEVIPDGIMLMKPSPLNIKSAFKTL
jgi:hypothetical protein